MPGIWGISHHGEVGERRERPVLRLYGPQILHKHNDPFTMRSQSEGHEGSSPSSESEGRRSRRESATRRRVTTAMSKDNKKAKKAIKKQVKRLVKSVGADRALTLVAGLNGNGSATHASPAASPAKSEKTATPKPPKTAKAKKAAAPPLRKPVAAKAPVAKTPRRARAAATA